MSSSVRAGPAAEDHPTACDHRLVRLVVDTDTGIDDALALMLLAALEDVEIVAVTTTHGNCTTEASTANARLVLDTCGLAHVPVIGGLSAPLEGELSTAWYVHGRDGLGDCGVAPPAALPTPPERNAVTALLDLAAANNGDLDLLALGPLTNLGAALRSDPAVLGAFRTVTVMGGVGPRLAPGAPDPTRGVGDPNTYHDPAAARIVAASPDAAVTMVGVDVTLNVAAGGAHLDRLAGSMTPHGRMAASITRFYLDFYERQAARGHSRYTIRSPPWSPSAPTSGRVSSKVAQSWRGRRAVSAVSSRPPFRVIGSPGRCMAATASGRPKLLSAALERPLPLATPPSAGQ